MEERMVDVVVQFAGQLSSLLMIISNTRRWRKHFQIRDCTVANSRFNQPLPVGPPVKRVDMLVARLKLKTFTLFLTYKFTNLLKRWAKPLDGFRNIWAGSVAQGSVASVFLRIVLPKKGIALRNPSFTSFCWECEAQFFNGQVDRKRRLSTRFGLDDLD